MRRRNAIKTIQVMVISSALWAAGSSAQELSLERPYTGDFHALYDGLPAATLLKDPHAQLLNFTTRLFRDTTIIDFEKRQVTVVRYDTLGFIIWTHHYAELNEYLTERAQAAAAAAWLRNSFLSKSITTQEKQQGIKFAWELPVQYPSWAQRVLGSEPPRLSINGSLRIKMAYEDVRRKESSVWQQAQSAGPGFNFEEQNQFTVTGTVGRLINIAISANSQSDVDATNPLKNFHIDYQESKPGELEDEIVQEVTAGYTGFSMPGTQLSGYSESHEGLFGIKVKSRFGPLTLTAIASTEQGESQKISISNSGSGSSGSTTPTAENRFRKFRYYFLDTAYIRYFNEKYALHGGNSGLQVPSPLEVRELQVWLKIALYDPEAILAKDPGRKIHDFLIDSTNETKYKFVRLEPERHYRLYPKEGYIRFTDSVAINEPDMVAIFFRTRGGMMPKGDTNQIDSLYPRSLWVLKSDIVIDSLGADPERFPLMWRNVYDIPGEVKDISKFLTRVYYVNKDTKDTTKTIDNADIGDIMGITKNGIPLIERPDIFNFENRELIFPPYDTSVNGNQPFANPALDTKDAKLRDTLIYLYDAQSTYMQVNNYQPVFTIEMSGSSKQTEFDLGLGVMENTVQVTADGRQLRPNIDYVLNTEVGRLELTSPAAKAAGKIDISYQREALFQPERKLFLGARAEMQLPFLSDNSLMGLSILFQRTSISQDIPRLGQEPYTKFLIDFNTRLDFKPAWMTALVNKLPLVSTNAPSSATVDFEIAHSRMNPNNEGEAYADDFESSKQVYSLGEGYKSWYRASPPYIGDSAIYAHPPAWDWYWFTPVYSDNKNIVLRDSVWENTENRPYTGTEKYETVLRLHAKPGPNDALLAGRFRQAWAGIMTPIPASMANRTRDQYFEILVKCVKGSAGKGRLRIQMGRMREDLSVNGATPNGRPDKEDTAHIWRESRDQNLDVGLDGAKDPNEKYYIPDGFGGWDSLLHGDSRLEEWTDDPAKDNMGHGTPYTEQNPGNYREACRYEMDGWSNESEDINNDGVVETGIPEKYHEFTIDLTDTNSPYIDRTAKLVKGKGWYRYRIPLHKISIGYRRDNGLAPDDWTNIRMVRLIWDGFDSTNLDVISKYNELIMEGMQFVGNQWEAVRDSLGNSAMDVSVINTREDLKYFYEADTARQKGLIHRQKDQTNNWQPEQALRLNFHGLLPGREALAQRGFALQQLNIASYDSLTLVVYGDSSAQAGYSGTLYNSDIQFIFRFGSDTSTFYEYRRNIKYEWDNFICVNLKQLSDLKLAWLTNHPGDSIDTINGSRTLRIKAPKGRQPNFANINWMAVGVIRSASIGDSINGELWVDELKVVGIKHFNGWSSRLNLQTQWADFLTLSAGLTYQGGDFRTMTDNAITLGDSRLSGNLNLATGLDKFMPKEWGVSMPIGGSISSSLTRPQLKAGTDVYLTDNNNNPDGFIEMARDVVNKAAGGEIINSPVTAAEHFETQTYGQNFYISYSKSNTSTNPAVDLLLQRLSTQFQYSMSTSHTNRGRVRSDSDSDYVNFDTSRSYSGGLAYDLSPRTPPRWTKWKPLSGSKASWLPGRWKEIEFSLLPGKISLNLANATYTNSMERRFEPGVNSRKYTKLFNLNHGLQIDYAPIFPLLDMSYSLTVNRDFPNNASLGSAGDAFRFIGDQIFARHTNSAWHDYYILQNERSRSQHFKMTINPQFADWFTNNADYTADYSGTLAKWGSDSAKDYMNAKVNSNVNYSSALAIGSLLQSASGPGGFGKIAAGMKKGFDFVGFNNINFTYSTNANLTNNLMGSDFLSSQSIGWSDFMAYQLGIGGKSLGDIISGDCNDRSALGGMRYRSSRGDTNVFYRDDNRGTGQTYQLSTSFRLAKPIELSISQVSLSWNKRITVRPDTAYFDTTSSFPEFRVGVQTSMLNKIKFISRTTQGMSLSSSFGIKRNTSNSSASGGTSTGKNLELSPLVAVDGTLKKWPVRFSYQHTLSQNEQASRGNSTTTARDGDNVDMNYEIQKTAGSSTIKLFKWSIPVRGRTTMGMRVARDHSTTVTAGIKTSDVSSLSMTPHLSYIFTDNVTGTLEYTFLKATDNGATTTTNTAALIAEIRF